MKRTLFRYDAEIISWTDGDTINLKTSLGFGIYIETRFRLKDIDTPEIHGVKHDSDEYKRGMAVLEAVEKKWPPGTQLIVESHKAGKYGRWLADLYENETSEIRLNDQIQAIMEEVCGGKSGN